MPTIEQLLPRFTTFQNKTLVVTPLSGGLTNTNYRVQADDGLYVVRLPGAKTELRAVDRAHEVYNARAVCSRKITLTMEKKRVRFLELGD